MESSSKTGELEAGRRGAISTLRFQVNTVINVDDPESLSMNGEKYENLDAADVEDMGFRQFQLSMKSQPVRVCLCQYISVEFCTLKHFSPQVPPH